MPGNDETELDWRQYKQDLENVRAADKDKAAKDIATTAKARRALLETQYEGGPGPKLIRQQEGAQEEDNVLDIQKAEKLKQKYIATNTEDVEFEIERLADRHNTEVCLRITGRPLDISFKTNSVGSFFASFFKAGKEIVNSLRGMPEEKVLRRLINDVKQVAIREVREEDQERIQALVKPLVEAVDDLAEAMQLVPKLIRLDNHLTTKPFEQHDAIQGALNEIYNSYEIEGRSAFFKPLGLSEQHVLNKDSWERYYKGLTSDLEHLPKLKPYFEKRQNIILNAKTEAELFEVEDAALLLDADRLLQFDKLAKINQFIDKHFSFEDESTKPKTKSYSKRFTKLKEMVGVLKSKRQARINQVKRQAEELFEEAKNQFIKWNQQLTQFKEDIANPQKGLGFPWTIFPPSKIDVEELKAQVGLHKAKFIDWPSASLVFDDDCMRLDDHDFVLNRMKAFGKSMIEDAFNYKQYKKRHNNKELPYQTLQEWINCYKTFLFKTMIIPKSDVDEFSKDRYEIDPEAIKIIDNMERELFFYAHRQIKQKQWFRCFRFSFWSKNAKAPASQERQVGWSNIIAHANGGNKKEGYTGQRTKETLEKLGWLQKDKQLANNPKSIPKGFFSSWKKYEQAERNLKISFTGKTVISMQTM